MTKETVCILQVAQVLPRRKQEKSQIALAKNMDNRSRSRSSLELVNLARAAYAAPELDTLLSGHPHSASVCTICRSLRSGVEDWLFVAVGSKYLRLRGALIAAALVADTQAMGLER
jgi:hypothetical protein